MSLYQKEIVMYDALEEAVKLISDLADELEYKIEVEGANNGK